MMDAARPLRVGIDGRLFGGKSGGIEQVVIGLADALSRLEDGNEEFVVLAYPRSHDWLAPYVRGRCRMLLTTAVEAPPEWKTFLKGHPRLAAMGEHMGGWLARKSVTLSESDGTIEKEGIDVMHFLIQRAFFTTVPSIYHPHDLLHRHLPRLLTRRERVKRDVMLGSFCRSARVVSVTSSWVKRDVIKQFDLPEEKVKVVPLAGSLGAYPMPTDEQMAATRIKFELPETFALYPAQTWPHKNHLALLDALARLRNDRGLIVPLICSGHQNEYFATIQKRIAALRLEDQVKFLGFVTPVELRALYQMCRCVIVPTLFEAASGPISEALMAGAPAACSNVTSLPEQVGDAALLFDPRDVGQMADAIQHLWTDPDLRAQLGARGKARIARWTWDGAARHFRALYRQIAGRLLTEEDQRLLAADPGI